MTISNLVTADLRADFSGPIFTPEDASYDLARKVFYPGYDRQPAAVVRVANDADVARVVAFARDNGLELAVRSGGHSIAGHSITEGGIVIHLGDMKSLDIDPKARTAWAQTGLTTGQYSAAAGTHGLATGFGDTGSVGIGGLTLGGGVGYLVRKYGLTIDNLLGADIVTADGQLLHIDTENHPDLFWAIRGGGGNFGVVTRFKFQLHPVDTIVGGMLFLPATPEVISGFIAAAAAAPEDLSTIANIMAAPPMPFIPEEAHGKLIIMGMFAFCGDTEAGERALAPFRALATPYADMLKPMPYPELFPEEEQEFPTAADIARTIFVDNFAQADAETIVASLQASTAPMAVCQLRVLGGAMARVPAEATAFAHRRRQIMVAVAALYNELSETAQHEKWVSDLLGALSQGSDGAYVNFLGNEGPQRVRAAFPGAHWERLRKVKAQYDPGNLFRLNQNIPPLE